MLDSETPPVSSTATLYAALTAQSPLTKLQTEEAYKHTLKYAKSKLCKLGDLGFKRSVDAVKAGFVCIRQAQNGGYRSTPGLWLNQSELQSTLIEACKAALDLETKKLERLQKQQATRIDIVKKAMTRLKIEDSLLDKALKIFSRVPLAQLTKKHDDNLRAQWVRHNNKGPINPAPRADFAQPLTTVYSKLQGQFCTNNRRDKYTEAKRLWKEDDPQFLRALSTSAEAAEAFISDRVDKRTEAKLPPQANPKAEARQKYQQALQNFLLKYADNNEQFRHSVLREKPSIHTLIDDQSASGFAEAIRAQIFETKLKQLLTHSAEYAGVFNSLKKAGNLELSTALQIRDYNTCRQIVENGVHSIYGDLKALLENPPAWFPLARKIDREITFIAGPTNSGKTHAAITELANAKTGVYLAPLRLLAHEVGLRLRTEHNLTTAIITGEEKDEPVNWTHCASTIEMLDPNQAWDVAVIDEAQMLIDRDRGWAWTHAMLGVAAKKVIILGAPAAEKPVRRLFQETREPLEIQKLTRLGPLQVRENSIGLKAIPKNSIIVAFSRRAVLSLAHNLIEAQRKVSVIYGALSPDVRLLEAARFQSGETEICVATDAIGMGLNLPAENLFFWELEKFDGVEQRSLNHSEILQIAGRAGRYGKFPIGYVGVIAGGLAQNETKKLKNALASTPGPLQCDLPVALTPELAERIAQLANVDRLSSFPGLRFPKPQAPWSWEMPTTYFEVAAFFKGKELKSSIATQARFCAAPVDLPKDEAFINAAVKAMEREKPLNQSFTTTGSLEVLEESWRQATLYLWLAMRWPTIYPNKVEAEEARIKTNTAITEILKAGRVAIRCKTCGKTLPIGHKFRECEPCYQKRRSHYYDNAPWGY